MTGLHVLTLRHSPKEWRHVNDAKSLKIRVLLQVHVLSLPGLNTLRTEKLGGEVIPRSVLLAVFEDIPYLLCALGDGQLFNWQLDAATGELRDKKKICLGTNPIMLRSFRCPT